MSKTLTHAELCQIAERWLRRSVGCGCAVSEMVSFASETPDAIGWKSGFSYLVEAKTSRADFFADRKKHFRQQPELGMGMYRYFITEPGLLKPDELPDRWGLLETTGKRVRVVHGLPAKSYDSKNEWNHDHSVRSEMILLTSALRRAQEVAA